MWSFLLRGIIPCHFNRVLEWARALLATFLSLQKSSNLLLGFKKLERIWFLFEEVKLDMLLAFEQSEVLDELQKYRIGPAKAGLARVHALYRMLLGIHHVVLL